jgi:hypothetical protein
MENKDIASSFSFYLLSFVRICSFRYKEHIINSTSIRKQLQDNSFKVLLLSIDKGLIAKMTLN